MLCNAEKLGKMHFMFEVLEALQQCVFLASVEIILFLTPTGEIYPTL